MSCESFKSDESADVVIIGGGVIGLAIARALRQRGVRDVVLCERGQLGAEASWAAGGILAPQVEADQVDDFFQLACTSRDLYPAFANSLREETGVDVELDTTGTLYLGFTDEDEKELQRRHEWQTRAKLIVERLNPEEARKLEPCIAEQVRFALRFRNDIQVENRKLVKALAMANEKLGVRLMTECDVRAIRVERGRVCAVETSLGVVTAPTVVLAAGAWTPLIDSPDIALPQIPIEPVRGQMLCFAARPPIAHHVIFSSRGYLVPRRDGRVLAGSTSEHAGFDKSVTDEGMTAIRTMAVEIAPALRNLSLMDSWAGFRPRAADGLPVLGACEGIEGLVYATGHYRNGILLTPITGEVIADAIVNRVFPESIQAFSPNRFGFL